MYYTLSLSLSFSLILISRKRKRRERRKKKRKKMSWMKRNMRRPSDLVASSSMRKPVSKQA